MYHSDWHIYFFVIYANASHFLKLFQLDLMKNFQFDLFLHAYVHNLKSFKFSEEPCTFDKCFYVDKQFDQCFIYERNRNETILLLQMKQIRRITYVWYYDVLLCKDGGNYLVWQYLRGKKKLDSSVFRDERWKPFSIHFFLNDTSNSIFYLMKPWSDIFAIWAQYLCTAPCAIIYCQ